MLIPPFPTRELQNSYHQDVGYLASPPASGTQPTKLQIPIEVKRKSLSDSMDDCVTIKYKLLSAFASY